MKANVIVDVDPKFAKIALTIAGFNVDGKSNEEICEMAIKMNDYYAVKTENITWKKTGHWIFVHPLQEDDGGCYMCSICNVGDWNLNGKENYCPNCGAKMQGVQK